MFEDTDDTVKIFFAMIFLSLILFFLGCKSTQEIRVDKIFKRYYKTNKNLNDNKSCECLFSEDMKFVIVCHDTLKFRK